MGSQRTSQPPARGSALGPVGTGSIRSLGDLPSRADWAGQEATPSAILSGLIGSIYDCAVDPGRWPSTLADIVDVLNFRTAAMSVLEMPSGGHLLSFSYGLEQPWLDRMLEHAGEIVEQWGGVEKIQSLPLDEPSVLSWVNDRSNWEHTRYYREWALPQGLVDVMAIPLARDAETVGSIGMGRHVSAGPITQREVDAARLLVPHAQRAVAISRLLETRSLAAETFRATLDTLRTAVILVDGDLRIVDANGPAQTILSTGDPIRSQHGRLVAVSPVAAAALAPAVRHAGGDEARLGQRSVGIPTRRADGTPCVLHVLPLQKGALRPTLAPRAVAAIFVAPAVAPSSPPNDALRALFDLTVTEGRVLSLLAAAMTISKVARELGVENSTAKTHLLRLFAKTGTSRQAELTALANSLAGPL